MFNVTVEQKELMKALSYLEPTVGKNAQGLYDNCIYMETTTNGTVRLITNNTIEYTSLEVITSSGTYSVDVAPLVDFKRFKAIINSIPSDEYIQIVEDKGNLCINYALKNNPIKLIGTSGSMLPVPTVNASDEIIMEKTLFSAAINGVCSIIKESTVNPIYNCVRLYTDGFDIEVTGLDYNSKRMFKKCFTSATSNPTAEILVEANKIKKSLKMFEDYNDIHFEMDNATVRITGEDQVPSDKRKSNSIESIEYYCRKINGNYPQTIAQSFTPEPTEYIELNKEEVLNIISRVKAIEDSTRTVHSIAFDANGGDVSIRMNSSYGDIEESFKAENNIINKISTVLNYDYIEEIAKTIDTDNICIGALPGHSTYYVIKRTGDYNEAFTIPVMSAIP